MFLTLWHVRVSYCLPLGYPKRLFFYFSSRQIICMLLARLNAVFVEHVLQLLRVANSTQGPEST